MPPIPIQLPVPCDVSQLPHSFGVCCCFFPIAAILFYSILFYSIPSAGEIACDEFRFGDTSDGADVQIGGGASRAHLYRFVVSGGLTAVNFSTCDAAYDTHLQVHGVSKVCARSVQHLRVPPA